MQVDLSHKIALVTGASRGIGQAIALYLAKANATVIGTATSQAGADKITEYLAKNHVTGVGMSLDVTQPEQIVKIMTDIAERYEAPAILVNNAGITRDNLLLRMDDEEWQAVIDTNLTAAFRMSRACLRGMMRARWGRIINVGSVVASSGNAGQTNYTAAKAGLIGFSKSLAQEVASRNITVNVVAPGFIETDMTKALPEHYHEELIKHIPQKRIGQPDDIAAAVAFLAAQEAGYITGQIVHVNGGMYMD